MPDFPKDADVCHIEFIPTTTYNYVIVQLTHPNGKKDAYYVNRQYLQGLAWSIYTDNI